MYRSNNKLVLVCIDNWVLALLGTVGGSAEDRFVIVSIDSSIRGRDAQ
jgi:hypothetical protein